MFQSLGLLGLVLTVAALLALPPELRPAPGCNRLFLALALLLAQAPLAPRAACLAQGLALHYGWLSAFARMALASCPQS